MHHCRRTCAMMRLALTAATAPAAAVDALEHLTPTPGDVVLYYHPLFALSSACPLVLSRALPRRAGDGLKVVSGPRSG